MKKEILGQAVLDYIGEKFKDKVVDKRVQTFFTYSELVDTVFSFAELLNKNIEMFENENIDLQHKIDTLQGYLDHDIEHDMDKNIQELRNENVGLKARLNAINLLTPELEKMSKLKTQQLTKAKELLKKCYENYIYLEPLRSEIKQFLEEK